MNRIEKYLNLEKTGFAWEDDLLLFTPNRLTGAVGENEKQEDHIQISSRKGKEISCVFYSSHYRVQCLDQGFVGREGKLPYCIDTTGLNAGDEIRGEFSILSNFGEYRVPYQITVKPVMMTDELGEMRNLFHFANLARVDFAQAVRLFYTEEFQRLFVGHDRQYYNLYRGLSVYPGNAHNVDEFLIGIHKKSAMVYEVAEDNLLFGRNAQGEEQIELHRKGWGHTDITVTAKGKFIRPEKEHLTEEDFEKDICAFSFTILPEYFIEGDNYGSITFTSDSGSVTVHIMIPKQKQQENEKQTADRQRRKLLARLMRLYLAYRMQPQNRTDILKEAETEAEVIKKNKLLEVKEKFLNKKADLEKEVALRNQKIQQAENKLKQREMVLSQRQEEIQRKKLEAEAVKENLEAQLVIVDKKKEELDKLQHQEIEKLETISGLSADEAKERLVESLKEEAKTQAQSFINDIMDDAKLTASKEAKRIVIQSIQRVATETAIENSVTVFHIESDEIKGRIIGREGRNIRALEAATGVEIVVDDTPEAIVLSAFDPVRREIARLALHQLVTDGRIHPARIEEVVAKVRKQVEEEIIETGKRTTIDLGIHGLHPELIRIIGKMKYRSSYGQNLLQHARETANLCAVMASELGLNPKKAKRAGLLHDIGKVPDDEPELPHAILGMKLCEKYKEKPDICNAVGAHHDEVEMQTLLAPIVQVCDAISGARPGARREIVEAYIKRLNDLEQLALSYPGVVKTYAIQAGRELRVIVGADKIDDKDTENLSTEIAKRIQDEMTYPGQVKITVIRETRAVSYAK